MQGIEFHLWEKKFTPNSSLGWFTILLKDVIPNFTEESKNPIWVDLVDGSGKMSLDVHYVPDKEELARQEKQKAERERSIRSTTTDFDFLYS